MQLFRNTGILFLAACIVVGCGDSSGVLKKDPSSTNQEVNDTNNNSGVVSGDVSGNSTVDSDAPITLALSSEVNYIGACGGEAPSAMPNTEYGQEVHFEKESSVAFTVSAYVNQPHRWELTLDRMSTAQRWITHDSVFRDESGNTLASGDTNPWFQAGCTGYSFVKHWTHREARLLPDTFMVIATAYDQEGNVLVSHNKTIQISGALMPYFENDAEWISIVNSGGGTELVAGDTLTAQLGWIARPENTHYCGVVERFVEGEGFVEARSFPVIYSEEATFIEFPIVKEGMHSLEINEYENTGQNCTQYASFLSIRGQAGHENFRVLSR